MQKIVFDKWIPNLSEDEKKLIFEIDDAILYYEFIELMNERLTPKEPMLNSEPVFDFVEFSKVEGEFLMIFNGLKLKKKG